MDSFSHYVGNTQDLVDFLAVAPRPARPEEADTQDGRVDVYEIPIETELQLKVLHTPSDGGDEDVCVQMLHKDRQIFYQNFSCVNVIVDKDASAKVFLVLYVGSTNLHLHKDPWHLHVENSDYYENTSSTLDDDY